MSPRVFHALVAALIRIGLLLALVIMLMAENAQAQPVQARSASFTGEPAPAAALTSSVTLELGW